ncbi:MAG: DUF4230 domain-containing protein [Anaerolineae bacterium]|nr:DUF4230 domain-containing protein [Anaerolineae bacterium]
MRLKNILMWIGIIVVIVASVWVFARSRNPSSPLLIDPSALLPQPTPTIYPSAATVIEGVQALSRLETASYQMEKVITAESGQGPLGFLFGDRLLLIAYGEMIAGVDLSYIGPSDLMTTGDGTVYVRLPAAEVFVATLDNSRTYVYDRRTGVAGLNMQLETAARLEAERLMLQAAIENGLLERAEENARDVLRSLLLSLGFKHVIFVKEMPTPTPAPEPAFNVTVVAP